jgi:phage terminase large subunit
VLAPVRKNLYVINANYGYGIDIVDIPKLIFDGVPQSRQYPIYADCSRPETISHLKKQAGYMIEGAEKWPGSVQDGITHLRGYSKIFIDPSLTQLIEEFRFYSHKVDTLTSKVLPDIVKGFDHGIDAMRYALGKMITRTPNIFDVL